MSKLNEIETRELLEAHANTGTAAALVDGAVRAHGIHPHVLEAVNDLIRSSAWMATVAFKVSGFTKEETLELNAEAEATTNEYIEQLNAAGATH